MKFIYIIILIFSFLAILTFFFPGRWFHNSEIRSKDEIYEMHELFEKDGIKLYSFSHRGNVHYFTSSGETLSTQSSRNGKFFFSKCENINGKPAM